MAETNIQEQISALSQKLDLVLEHVEQQKRNREEIEDLVADMSIVAKDAFRNTVTLLDKSQVDLDQCGLSMLMVRLLQNLDTFREMLEMLESARDFMKDVSPILHQVGLDAVNKMNELDQKGYFESLSGIARNLTRPELLAAMNRATAAIAEVKPDDKLDDKSLLAIFRQMNSPEVRKSLSYSLRLLQAMNR